MKPFGAQSYYELLEISVSANAAEIRAACDRLTRMYADDQLALYGLTDATSAAALRKRLREAMEVLTDDELRGMYDEEIGLPAREEEPVVSQLEMGELLAGADHSVASTHPRVAFTWSASSTVQPVAASAPPATVAVPPAAESARLAAVESVRLAAVESVRLAAAESARLAAVENARLAAAENARLAAAENARLAAAENARLAAAESKRVADAESAGAAESKRRADAESRRPADPGIAAAEAARPAAESARGAEPRAAAEPDRPESGRATAPAPAEAERMAEEAAIAMLPRASPRPPAPSAPERPRMPDISADAEYNGELLRKVRTALGLSLAAVAERTRIGSKHLENVEADRYDALPATVYLRGILMSLARELRLDGVKVSRSYLSLVERIRSKG